MIQMNKREKKLLAVLIALITGLVLYYLIISPLVNFKKNADRSLELNFSKINRLDDIYAEYKDIQLQKNQLNVNAENSTITSIVEEAASSLGISSNRVLLDNNPGVIKDGIQLMTTEIKFEGLSIKNLLSFIYKVENSGAPVKIKKLTVTAGFKGKNRYDLVMTTLSLQKR